MYRPYIVGLSASNRSMLSIEDESRITTKINEILVNEDFAIHDLKSDGASMPAEVTESLKSALDAKHLSNSEIALIVALTAAKSQRADVSFFSLKNLLKKYNSNFSNREKIIDVFARSSGIILASPVYFGDRSSIVQQFLQILYKDETLANALYNKIFSGVCVGAKRNGGQETLLIYQLLDFLEFNMLGVGNDSESTAQYGGTCTAGEIGTMLNDAYGISTTQGTGRRVANVTKILANSKGRKLKDKLKIGFFLLQDSKSQGKKHLTKLINNFSDHINPQIYELSESFIEPCLACKYCPLKFGHDEDYRCAVNNGKDFFQQNHAEIIGLDAIVMTIFSPSNKQHLKSMYQLFVERTRYLRRSDYIYSNIPFIPLVLEEINGNQNFHIRITTSFIRQETIVSRPIVGIIDKNTLLNKKYVEEVFSTFIEQAKKITIARLIASSNKNCFSLYNPVGYTLKYKRDFEQKIIDIRKQNLDRRCHLLQDKMLKRVV